MGGSGYTGVELLRLLLPRSDVTVTFISSRANRGARVDSVFTNLRGFTNLCFVDPDDIAGVDCDVVFFATPNGTAMRSAPALLERGIKVIDLSADFRLKHIPTWETWYGMTHESPEWVERAVYGLPELHRSELSGAQLVANPGCYPTAVQLGFLPLLEQNLVDATTLIADAKSGISGAGRSANVNNLLAEMQDNFHAYGVAGHRHLPEIEQGLQALAGAKVELTFVPHLLPIIRGIHSTLYARLTAQTDLQSLYEKRFANEPFVDVLPSNTHPETRSVRGTNMVRLAVNQPQGRGMAVVCSVEDNLVKGAAGQAIQNMNLMLGLPETTGLITPAQLP